LVTLSAQHANEEMKKIVSIIFLLIFYHLLELVMAAL